jgi:hypothetical protein
MADRPGLQSGNHEAGRHRSNNIRATAAVPAKHGGVFTQAPPFGSLFQKAGNQGIGRMLASGRTPARRNVFGERVQSKADGVPEMALPAPAGPLSYSALPLQRKCSHCEEEEPVQRKCAECEKEEKPQRRKAGPEPAEKSSGVQQALGSAGQALEKSTREQMEPKFGHDFSRVRVHTDTAAASSARSLNAQAYTVGEHVVFAAGRYAPETQAGQSLIAHELTHVVQQQNGFRAETGAAADQAEQEALTNEQLIHWGGTLTFSAHPARIARKDETTTTAKVPTGPPDCTPKQGEKIQEAARTAIQWLDKSITKVRAFIEHPTDKSNKDTSQALERHFNSTDPAIAQRVLKRVEMIRHDIDSARQDPQLETECHDKSGDPTCDTADAHVPADRSKLIFCETFFDEDSEERAETVVHEMAHAIMRNITDRGYRSDRMLGKADGKAIMSVPEALTNAESYGMLVQELGTGKKQESTAPEDSYADECKEMEPLLRVAMARAGRWNRAGETGVRNAPSSLIKQNLGADTPQNRKDAFDFYHEAQQGLAQSFDFACDRKCNRMASGQTAGIHALSTGGKWAGILGAVGTVVGLVAGIATQSVGLGLLLGGLIGGAIGFIGGLIGGASPKINVCPKWKDLSNEGARIEWILAAAYEALGTSTSDSLKYAKLARAIFTRRYPMPTMSTVDRELLERRLGEVQDRLLELRAKYRRSMKAFVQSVGDERRRESLARGVRGKPPPERPRPTPDSEDFDPGDELDRMKRDKESELAKIREKRQRIDDSMESVKMAEEIMRLEQEEKDLQAQLDALP